MILIALFIFLCGICFVSYISAGKEKDFNKFMGNFRN